MNREASQTLKVKCPKCGKMIKQDCQACIDNNEVVCLHKGTKFEKKDGIPDVLKLKSSGYAVIYRMTNIPFDAQHNYGYAWDASFDYEAKQHMKELYDYYKERPKYYEEVMLCKVIRGKK